MLGSQFDEDCRVLEELGPVPSLEVGLMAVEDFAARVVETEISGSGGLDPSGRRRLVVARWVSGVAVAFEA